jgi:NAD(P)-dependent dehydrogenase (short-subunit alcohol dehydrogenase family)
MGASLARGFVAEGANAVIADVLEQEARTLADELGRSSDLLPPRRHERQRLGGDGGRSRGRLQPGLRTGQ